MEKNKLAITDPEILKRLQDPRFYLENFCKVKTKSHGLKPFILKQAQLDIFNEMKKHNRIMILKSRQMGFSTAVTGFIYHQTITKPGTTSALIGYNSTLTSELLDKVKIFYRTTPEELRPTINYNSKYEISFPSIDSKILVLPSTENVGRGYTINLALCISGEIEVFKKNGFTEKVKNIIDGDYIINGSGGLGKVKRVIKKVNDKRLLKLDIVGNDPLITTDDHEILIRGDKSIGFKPIWKKSSELNIGDRIGYPYFQCRNIVSEIEMDDINFGNHGGNRKKVKQTIKINKAFGRFVGWYLAEGSSRDNKVNISIDKDEVDQVMDVINNSIKDNVSSVSVSYSKTSRTAIINIYGINFTNFIINKFGRIGQEKFINDCIWYWGYEFGYGLLEGLFKGDGYLKNNRLSVLTNTNKQLIYQVKKLLISLRIGMSNIRHADTNRYGKKTKHRYDLQLNGKANYKFRKKIGLELPVYNNNRARWLLANLPEVNQGHGSSRKGRFYFWSKIKKISESNNEEFVYDIVMEKDPHSFLTKSGVVHNCTELAFWEKAEEKMTSLENSIPEDGKIIIESTPNGQGNLYHKMWFAKDNIYRKKEYNWHWEYSKEWIEKKKKAMNNPMKFAQEYELEFLASGRNVFDQRIIKAQRQNVLEVGAKTKTDDGKDHIVQEIDGWRIYKPPTPDGLYVVGADVSEGVEGGDYSVAHIFNRRTGEEVAMYRGLIAPDRFGETLNRQGRAYNNALMVVEVNNHGLTTITILKQLVYPLLYFRPAKFEHIGSTTTDKIGWQTNRKTRPILIDDFAQVVRDGELIIHSEELLNEMTVFIYDNANNMIAQEGFHDDCLRKGTLIKTIDGYKEIEKIKPGELVLTHKNRYRKVEACIEKPFNGVWHDVKFNGQLNLGLSYNHPIYVATGNYKGTELLNHNKRQWKFPKELLKSYKSVSIIEKFEMCKNTYINGIDNKHGYGKKNVKIILNKDFAKFLGLFLAEGHCCKKTNQMSLAFNERDIELISEMKQYIESLKMNVTEKHTKDKHCIVLYFTSKTLSRLMKQCYDEMYEKQLPKYANDLGKELKEVLRYWLIGDGWNSKKSYDTIGATTSKKLALAMRDISWSVGYYSVIQKVTRKRYGIKTKDQYWVSIKKTFNNQQHLEKNNVNEYIGKLRSNKKSFYNGNVYNLQVEEDKSFIADGVVVHNCIFAAAICNQGFKVLYDRPLDQINLNQSNVGLSYGF